MVLITTSCCLNVSPTSKAAARVGWKKNESESWRNPCVIIGMAASSMLIGLEMSNSVIFDETYIAAYESMSTSSTLIVAESNGRKATKWSDKRSCPAWRVNSLETIVPENLPRPSTRRRWEAIGFDSKSTTAPPVKVATVKTSSPRRCFSL